MCLGASMLPLYMIFLLGFRTVQTVWNILSLILLKPWTCLPTMNHVQTTISYKDSRAAMNMCHNNSGGLSCLVQLQLKK